MNGNQTKMSKPTKTYDLYEVVKVPFPFTDIKNSKIRPAVILSSAKHFNAKIGLSVMAMITSVKEGQDFWPADVVIKDLSHAGLPASSLVRFKLFTLDHRLVLGRLGKLSQSDQKHVQEKLQTILSL